MIESHRAPRVVKSLLACFGLAALLLPGCADNYSESRQYPLRTDPIVTPNKDNEYPNPDRPGQLPLFTLKDMEDPRNPLYGQREKILTSPDLRDPTLLDKEFAQELDDVLRDVFGTPADPRVDLRVAGFRTQDADTIRDSLQISGDMLTRGSKLYRQHCLHCHGLTGDGRGPTSKWVNPHPRDYRQGLFKFTSVDQVEFQGTRRPRREDLYRVLHQGIEGTAMPAFNLLTDPELEALVSYVIHLSIRGYAEYSTLTKMTFDEQTGFSLPRDWNGGIEGYLLKATSAVQRKGAIRQEIELWHESQNKLIVPSKIPDYQGKDLDASIRRGWYLFKGTDEKGNKVFVTTAEGQKIEPPTCMSCHKDYGRKAEFKFDDWATMVRPNNLTKGVYRGGRRPIDIFWRIHSGIAGSGMNRFGKTVIDRKDVGIYSSDQIWDLVNFVRALPYPAMREKAGVDIQ